MKNKELKRLSRQELLEIMIDQTKEINSLRDKIQNLESELSEKRVTISESGSLAEASMKLNRLFADADKAAKQYLDNAILNEEESRKMLEDARKKKDEMLAKAEEIRRAKISEADLYMERVNKAVQEYLLKYPEMRSVANEEKQ